MRASFRYLLAACVAGALQTVSAAPIFIGSANMNGAQEVPPDASTATGFVTLSLDGNTLDVSLTFSGLTGGTASAAHIHCCTPPGTSTGIALPFTGFPALTGGSYIQSFDLTSAAAYNSAFLSSSGGTAAGAEAALLAGIAHGMAYANIHDATFPGGEISGFITPAPEPSSILLTVFGFAGLAWGFRRLRAWRTSDI